MAVTEWQDVLDVFVESGCTAAFKSDETASAGKRSCKVRQDISAALATASARGVHLQYKIAKLKDKISLYTCRVV